MTARSEHAGGMAAQGLPPPIPFHKKSMKRSTAAGVVEMLVLDATKRHLNATSCFGLDPGLIRTNTRSNLLGADTLRYRFIEWMIDLITPAAKATPSVWRRSSCLRISKGTDAPCSTGRASHSCERQS